MELLLLLLLLVGVRRPVAGGWTRAAWEKFWKKMPLVTNGMMRGGGCFGAVAAAAAAGTTRRVAVQCRESLPPLPPNP